LEEDPFDLLVQLSNPMIKVGIAFKVKSIDLGRNVSADNRADASARHTAA
jgi:hypothetical protein